jgi:hypothetical protein
MYKNSDYYSEVFISRDNNTCQQYYITYDKSKIKGFSKDFKSSDIDKYIMKAWARIPISSIKILDLKIHQLKNKEIENFTVQYRTTIHPSLLKDRELKIKLLPSKSQDGAHMMLIRTDYGHGKDLKHINIDIYNKKKEKITDTKYSFLPQTFQIHNYEMALHYVFMQVEKHNPLVGPKYWLSPCQIHEERLMPTFKAWKESRIMTPLCILSRNILVNIIFRTYDHDEIISDDKFIQILNEEIDKTREFENKNPEYYKVDMPSSDQIFVYLLILLFPTIKQREKHLNIPKQKKKIYKI